MQIFNFEAKELQAFSCFSIIDEKIPITIPELPGIIIKDPKPPKMVIDDNITCEIINIALGKNSKDEIVSAVITKYPLIAKASIYKIIKSNLVKKKEGKINTYRKKEENLVV